MSSLHLSGVVWPTENLLLVDLVRLKASRRLGGMFVKRSSSLGRPSSD